MLVIHKIIQQLMNIKKKNIFCNFLRLIIIAKIITKKSKIILRTHIMNN